MKKSILFMFVMMTLGASFSISQSNILLASNLENNNSNFSHNDPLAITVADYSKTSTTRIYDIPESASNVQMTASAGQLNLSVKSDIKYTKAEILSLDSNTTAQILQLSNNNKSVDITEVVSGTYYMILSNDEGDVFSEKIIIL